MQPSTTITTKVYNFGRHQFRSITESAVSVGGRTFELVMSADADTGAKTIHPLNGTETQRLYEILREEFGPKAMEG